MIGKMFLHFLGFLISCLYPAFLSYKALGNGSQDELNVWMKYWVVYASFAVFDYFASVLLTWIPYFEVLKLAFLFWLLPVVGDGSEHLYELYLQPLFIEYDEIIEEIVGQTLTFPFGIFQRITRWFIENFPKESEQQLGIMETIENETGTIETQNETIKCENPTEAEELKRVMLLKSSPPKPPMRPISLKNTPKLTDIPVNPFEEEQQWNGTA